MKRVIIEILRTGQTAVDEAYVEACLRDSLNRGEAPFEAPAFRAKSLGLYGDIADETVRSVAATIAWGRVADLVAVYMDRGIMPPNYAEPGEKYGLPVERRMLDRAALQAFEDLAYHITHGLDDIG